MYFCKEWLFCVICVVRSRKFCRFRSDIASLPSKCRHQREILLVRRPRRKEVCYSGSRFNSEVVISPLSLFMGSFVDSSPFCSCHNPPTPSKVRLNRSTSYPISSPSALVVSVLAYAKKAQNLVYFWRKEGIGAVGGGADGFVFVQPDSVFEETVKSSYSWVCFYLLQMMVRKLCVIGRLKWRILLYLTSAPRIFVNDCQPSVHQQWQE